MAGELYKIIKWVEQNGEPRSVNRIGIKHLVDFMKAGIVLQKVDQGTAAPPALLTSVRATATSIVGKRCPV